MINSLLHIWHFESIAEWFVIKSKLNFKQKLSIFSWCFYFPVPYFISLKIAFSSNEIADSYKTIGYFASLIRKKIAVSCSSPLANFIKIALENDFKWLQDHFYLYSVVIREWLCNVLQFKTRQVCNGPRVVKFIST